MLPKFFQHIRFAHELTKNLPALAVKLENRLGSLFPRSNCRDFTGNVWKSKLKRASEASMA
jgi:hypothetical protein